MIKGIKNYVLTKLFTDWVKNEKDVEKLILTKQVIQKYQNELTGYKPVIGFKVDRTG
jgi:hypothetical protein|tara:strand:+ start:241 stop:411 length:171 start_codon:yes stop_codon:yes gene_type:complete